MTNFYSLLGITENASTNEINEAYKKLAQKFHPDKNNNDPYFLGLFKQLNEAKQTLSDPEKKSEYDLLLTNYADAYSVFINQRHEEEFNRQQRMQQVDKAAFRKKNILIFLGLALVLFVFFMIWIGMRDDVVIFNSKEKQPVFQGIVSDSIVSISSDVKPRKKMQDEKKLNEAPEPIKQEADNYYSKENTINVRKSFKKEGNNEGFTNAELSQILTLINTERSKNNYSTNCITIKKTKNSKADANFSVAPFLQKKGFIISGRETIQGSFKGYTVKFDGVCLNLFIGDM